MSGRQPAPAPDEPTALDRALAWLLILAAAALVGHMLVKWMG